eukprot:1098251-Pyramimonas_sp.AAC.1
MPDVLPKGLPKECRFRVAGDKLTKACPLLECSAVFPESSPSGPPYSFSTSRLVTAVLRPLK